MVPRLPNLFNANLQESQAIIHDCGNMCSVGSPHDKGLGVRLDLMHVHAFMLACQLKYHNVHSYRIAALL